MAVGKLGGFGCHAQRHLRDDAVALDLCDAPEADAPAAQAKPAQKEGPQQQTRHQIGGDGGQMNDLGKAGHQEPGDQREGQADE